MAETTAGKQRRGCGRPFKPGMSGNPAGRPKGARHRVTMLAEQLLDGDAKEIIRKTITLGLAGEVAALRLLLDRILPPRRDRPVAFSLPALTTPHDAAAALAALVDAVAAGNLTPQEACDLSGLIGNFVRAIETVALEERVHLLEETLKEARL
jgi:uncharacterized protein DUF5681